MNLDYNNHDSLSLGAVCRAANGSDQDRHLQ
jgi:hypothetical protein